MFERAKKNISLHLSNKEWDESDPMMVTRFVHESMDEMAPMMIYLKEGKPKAVVVVTSGNPSQQWPAESKNRYYDQIWMCLIPFVGSNEVDAVQLISDTWIHEHPKDAEEFGIPEEGSPGYRAQEALISMTMGATGEIVTEMMPYTRDADRVTYEAVVDEPNIVEGVIPDLLGRAHKNRTELSEEGELDHALMGALVMLAANNYVVLTA